MILSEWADIKISPANAGYWRSKGYVVGNTGGRGGKNTGQSLRVKVADLAPGSNVMVRCRCEGACQREYENRFCRYNPICDKCRAKNRMKNNNFGSMNRTHEVPPKADLEKILSGAGKAEAARNYGVTIPTVNGWIKIHGIEVDRYQGTVKKIPDDFIEWYNTNKPMKKEIEEKYNISAPTVARWIVDCKLPYRGATSRIDTPPLETLIELNKEKDSAQLAEHFGVSMSSIVTWFRRYDYPLKVHRSGTSKEQIDFFNFISSVCEGFLPNRKSILENGYLELDAYHPEMKIAFEYDGLFWHNNHDPNSHREKFEACEEIGIKLYRLNSDEWLNQRSLVESMVKVRLGKVDQRHHARKLEVVEISSPLAEEFHSKNHIAGYVNSSVNIGLFDHETLVSVMSFAKNRYNPDYEWEVTRFSSLMNRVIVGGAGKIFKLFVDRHNPKSILCFADLRWGRGKVYQSLGFSLIGRTKPTYWYYHNNFPGKRFSRQKFQKKNLPNKLAIFDPDKTEHENMTANKYWRYWDCGNEVYVWKSK